MSISKIILVGLLVFILFAGLVPVVLANGEHAPGEEHDGSETARTEGVRWPVLAGGAIAILVVAVLAYKFIVK